MRGTSIVIMIIACLVPCSKSMAQADISMATHWYNRANYNPASIARADYIYLFSDVREQWVGVEGAPKVFNIQGSEYIHRMRSAFGISLVGDRIGVTQAYNPMVTYAYRISNQKDWAFSLGLSAGIFTRFIDGSLYEPVTVTDPSIVYDKNSITRPDANVGIEFKSVHFIVSASSTHLFSIEKTDNLFLNTNHRYGSVIYMNTTPEIFNFNTGIQIVNRKDLTVAEGSVGLRFKRNTGLRSGPREIFDLGLTYRTSQSMTLLLGFNVTRDFRIGYAWDQSFVTGYYPNPTNEIMLEYRIPSKASTTWCECEDMVYWYR